MDVGYTLDNLNVNSFKADIDKIPFFNYKLQEVRLPGMQLGVAETPTPFQKMKVPGDQIVYDQIGFTFIVDEDLSNYLAIQKWMHGLGFPDSFEDYQELIKFGSARAKRSYEVDETSDIVVHMMTNHRNPNMNFKYLRAFPVSLSGLELSVTNTTSHVVTATAMFEFTGMEYNRVRGK